MEGDTDLPDIELVDSNRKNSIASSDGNHFEENGPSKENDFSSMVLYFLGKVWASFRPILVQRLINCLIVCLIMLLILYGNSNNMNTLVGASGNVGWKDWFLFAGFVFAVNTIFSLLDIVFFMAVDKYVNGPIYYYIDTYRYHGSLAVALTVVFTDSAHQYFIVPQAIANWSDVMAAIVVVAICYIFKEYMQRANYDNFIVSRFSERVKRMDVHRVILSRLASWKSLPKNSDVGKKTPVSSAVKSNVEVDTVLNSPPVPLEQMVATAPELNFITDSPAPTDDAALLRDSIISLPGNFSVDKGLDILGTVADVDATLPSGRVRSNSDPIALSFEPIIRARPKTSDRTKEQMSKLSATARIQKDIVLKGLKAKFGPKEEKERELERLKEKAKRAQKELEFISSPADIFSELIDEDDENANDSQKKSTDTLVKKSFWKEYRAAASGSLSVTTIAGTVVIRDTKQAREFGKKLYSHLKRGYYVKCKYNNTMSSPSSIGKAGSRYSDFQLNANALKEILQEYMTTQENEDGSGPDAIGGAEEYQNPTDDFDWMLRACYEQFHCDVDAESRVSETRVVEACVELYKEFKYMALSLADNRKLRNSINNVTDVGFWLSMLIVGQIILKVDPLLIITPLLSIILLLSFALGTVLGNIFLAIGFVIFMLPFDVGDRVTIGVSNRINCNILSVNLLTTEVITLHNEKVQYLCVYIVVDSMMLALCFVFNCIVT